jgi:anti-sigma B factor antagonist
MGTGQGSNFQVRLTLNANALLLDRATDTLSHSSEYSTGASIGRVNREVTGMALEITETLSGPVTVLALKGRITLGDGTQVLRNRVTLALDNAKWHKERWDWSLCLVLDLAQVDFMDSAGLGALVGIYATARHHEAKMKLANLTKMLQEQLIITKLSTVFEVYNSVEEAKASCG